MGASFQGLSFSFMIAVLCANASTSMTTMKLAIDLYHDDLLQVVGRHTIQAEVEGVSFDMPGVRLITQVSDTTSLTATMSSFGIEPPNEASFFIVKVDGIPQFDSSSAYSTFSTAEWQSGEAVDVLLCTGLDPTGSHTIEIFKNTEAQWNEIHVADNYITLVAMKGDDGVSFNQPPALPERRVEFLGDSITAGFVDRSPGSKINLDSKAARIWVKKKKTIHFPFSAFH